MSDSLDTLLATVTAVLAVPIREVYALLWRAGVIHIRQAQPSLKIAA